MDDTATDLLFFDPAAALEQARRQERIRQTKFVSARQNCFYISVEPLTGDDLPDTLLHVPADDAIGYFATTRYRWPTRFQAPSLLTDPADLQHLNLMVQEIFSSALERRSRRAQTLTAIIRAHHEPAPTSGPLRVFGMASRLTTVMQHATRGMLNGFARLGHETRFVIEADDREDFSALRQLEAIEAFRPHVVININHLNNGVLPPQVLNVVWWQDPMPELLAGQPLTWRPNDLCYTVDPARLAPLVAATGLPLERIGTQPFCIDTTVFRPDDRVPRERKAVFVGSSARLAELAPAARAALEEIEAAVTAGTALDLAAVTAIAQRHGCDPALAFFELHHLAVRDLPVRWLCRQRAVPVEIWGRGWEVYPEVAPYFRGEVAHGRPLADVYRSATWALNAHSQQIQHNRLAESAACGCIPVVYDSRYQSAPPHWEDESLFFRTETELHACLERTRPTRPERFQERYDYAAFARRILADAAPLLHRPGDAAVAAQAQAQAAAAETMPGLRASPTP